MNKNIYYADIVEIKWFTYLFNSGFSHPIYKPSFSFSWNFEVSVSRMEKQLVV